MKHILPFLILILPFSKNLDGQNSICQPYIFKNVEPQFINNSNGNMFYIQYGADEGLWRSDGTLQGTYKINTAPPPGFIEFFNVAFNGFTYFTSLSPVQLWKTDGTDAGTTMVKEIPNVNRIYQLTAASNQLFFLVEGSNYINKLWKTDGTTNGTGLVLDIDPTNSSDWDPIRMCALNNDVFFNAGTQTNGVEIWKSDGTAAGTQIVKEIGPGFQYGTSHLVSSFMGVLNGKVFFHGGVTNSGQQGLWQTDGTEQGTTFIKAIRDVGIFYQVGDLLFFSTYGEQGIYNGEELWVTDGTVSGTNMLKDINPGSGSGYNSSADLITEFNGKIIFAADDGTHGYEPWISDGTEAGTFMLKDIKPDQYNYRFAFSEIINGLVYFRADDGIHGIELWVTDGTSQGTFLASDIVPGIDGSGASSFNVLNNNLFFKALAPGAIDAIIWSCGNLAGTNDVQKQEFEIYPNPSSGILHISNAPQGSRIKLINTIGQVLVNMDSMDAQTTLDVSRFSNGLYSIILESDGSLVTRKVLIEK